MSGRSQQGFLSLALGAMLVALALPVVAQRVAGGTRAGVASPSSVAQHAALASRYGQLPLSFELNEGQAAGPARFLAHGQGYTLALTPGAALLALTRSAPAAAPFAGRAGPRLSGQPALPARANSQPPAVVGMQWLGANPNPEVTGENQLPGTVNYFIGNDPAQWHTNIPTYQQVRLHNVFPGIDLVYYGNAARLEYDFVVAPGADPSRIQLGFTGASQVGVDLQGNLRLALSGGTVQEDKPLVYQTVNGARQSVAGGYVLTASQRARFALGTYNPRLPLVIDPAYKFSTYLGGTGLDWGNGIAVDSAGNAYVAGYTSSTDFPLAHAFQSTFPTKSGYSLETGFVTKFNAAGTTLLYSTYFGGGDDASQMASVAVDSAGDAYIAGTTFATDYPTVNAIQSSNGGNDDAVVAELNPTGSALIYSTYLGGSGYDYANGIAVDSTGAAFVTGTTNSPAFPVANAFQNTYGGNGDVFVAKIAPAGGSLAYSTFLGGAGQDNGAGIAVDASGNAYVTGDTASGSFPLANAEQATYGGGGFDAFVSKLNATGSALIYSTFLGGSDWDIGNALAVDSSGQAYVTGYTWSADFPTANALQSTRPNNNLYPDVAFVAKFNAAGSAFVYSTYLDGSNETTGYGIAADSAGDAYVTGLNFSTDFPTANPLPGACTSSGDVFVSRLNASGSALMFSSCFGGSAEDTGQAIALGQGGNVYLTGETGSFDFPMVNALYPTMTDPYANLAQNAFVTKIRILPTVDTTTGVFRPSNGVLYLKNANTTGPADITLYYGKPGDHPITGDWTGTGYKSIGIYRGGTFYLRNSNTTGYADIVAPFGNSSDIPVAGDWTGKGYDSIGVYRPSTNTFLLRNTNTAGPPDLVARLGISGDVPIVGDWTGKGWDSIGVFRPSNGIVYLRNSNTTGVADINFVYGIAGDKPVVGDWTGQGFDTIGVDRNGRFLLRNSNSTGPANFNFYLGVSGDDPIAGPWLAPPSSPPPVHRGPSGSGTHAPAPAAHQPGGANLPRTRTRAR